MKPFETFRAVALPFLHINVDTDVIIPSREMKKVSKKGLGEGLFAGLRYRGMAGRVPDPDFILNDAAYDGAAILLGGLNFGCGSSREHAVWALGEYGFRVIIAPSFGSIFYNNCIRNGLLAIELDARDISRLAKWVAQDPQENRLAIDLERQQVSGSENYNFDIAARDRGMLLKGYDMIDMTLRRMGDITAFEQKDRLIRPWAKLD